VNEWRRRTTTDLEALAKVDKDKAVEPERLSDDKVDVIGVAELADARQLRLGLDIRHKYHLHSLQKFVIGTSASRKKTKERDVL
jgi:hypothetical protein